MLNGIVVLVVGFMRWLYNKSETRVPLKRVAGRLIRKYVSSKRVLEKVGFEHEEIKKNAVCKRDKSTTLV